MLSHLNGDSHELSAQPTTSLVVSTRTCSHHHNNNNNNNNNDDSDDSPRRIRKEEPDNNNDNKNTFQTTTLIRRAILGGLAGGYITLCCLLLVHLVYPSALPHFSRVVCPRGFCHDWNNQQQLEGSIRGAPSPPTGVDSYLNHFGAGTPHNSTLLSPSKRTLAQKTHHPQSHQHHHHQQQRQQQTQRKLASSFKDQDPELVIAGKMMVEDGPCNIAQLDLKTSKWSLIQRIQLSLYNSYSGGEVYSLLANYTQQIPVDDHDDTDGVKKYVYKLCVSRE